MTTCLSIQVGALTRRPSTSAPSARRRSYTAKDPAAARADSQPPARRYASIPYLRMSAWKFGRAMPTSSAARVTFPSARSSAAVTN